MAFKLSKSFNENNKLQTNFDIKSHSVVTILQEESEKITIDLATQT